MKPTIGGIVVYKTTADDKKQMQRSEKGCNVQNELPAVVTAVLSENCVNLRVLCDGNQTLWKTSINHGKAEGNWRWPVPPAKE